MATVKRVWIAVFLFLYAGSALADTFEHTLMRRISVFPFEVPEEVSAKADEVWWEMREFLTKDKRFLVATKNFLQQQNVYHPRSELDPAAAIILGKLLDADAVMTTFLRDGMLHMAVYESKYGRPLWAREIQLQPSLPVGDQLSAAALRLVRDFISSIPYQGFVVLDPMKDGAVYHDGKRLLFKADVGTGSEAAVGDAVDVIRITTDRLDPIFARGGVIEVYGQGRIVAADRDFITVEIQRVTHSAEIQEKSLVRLPKELRRLEQQYSIVDPLRSKVSPEILSPEISTVKETVAERKPLVASLVFIFNLAAFFLLAF